MSADKKIGAALCGNIEFMKPEEFQTLSEVNDFVKYASAEAIKR